MHSCQRLWVKPSHESPREVNLLIWVPTDLITYGVTYVLQSDFLHEKWLPLSIGDRNLKSFG